jgi:hypothetical protein
MITTGDACLPAKISYLSINEQTSDDGFISLKFSSIAMQRFREGNRILYPLSSTHCAGRRQTQYAEKSIKQQYNILTLREDLIIYCRSDEWRVEGVADDAREHEDA